MSERGIFQYWKTQRRGSLVPPRECQLSTKKSGNSPTRRLSLKDLTGAFVILIIGCTVSIIVFIGEKIMFHKEKTKKLEKAMAHSNVATI